MFFCKKMNKVMGYTILSASKYVSKLKATVHASGKLGFSEVTAKD